LKTKVWAIILMVICTFLISIAQFLYKAGAETLELNILSIITNWPLILGVTLYGIGGVLVIIALKGGEVSVLYPILTSSYVWVTLGSKYFFQEVVSTLRWTGVFFIVFGILVVTLGSKKKEAVQYMEPI
jgi:drug/metabolite transporter (DMT)-like permease